MEHIDATAARKLYPNVKGEIFGAVLCSGFAVLDMGIGAYGVMVAGEMVGCCPTFDLAHAAGEKGAEALDRKDKLEALTRSNVTVRARRMASDSFYRQVIGKVAGVHNGHVSINATFVMSKWSKEFEAHPTSCLTSAAIDDVEIIGV